MEWAAGVIFFDDKKSLGRCLDSIHEHVDYLICVDGRFAEFEAPNNLSTDGSRETVCSYPNSILVDFGGRRQPEKRNKYLQLAAELGVDTLLVVDSDQYVEGDFLEFKENALKAIEKAGDGPCLFSVRIRNEKEGFSYTFDSQRVYFRPQFLRMHPVCHYYLYDTTHNPPLLIRTTKIPRGDTVNHHSPTIEGIELRQNDTLRDEEWRIRMFNHQKWQVLYEIQWHYRQRGIIKDHLSRHGYEAIDTLLEAHPRLSELMTEYEYREVPPHKGFFANPELADYVIAVGEYLEGQENS
ncbi:MAG: glycosyltransferase family A protein [Candidatus Thorarchaeota archaeon]